MSLALVVALTVVNCLGVRESADLQNLLTILKFLMVFFVAFMACFYILDDSQTLRDNLAPENAFSGSNGVFGFFNSMVACLWAFDGW